MKPILRKIDCYSVTVGSVEEAIAFYERLGCSLKWRDGDAAAGFSLPESDSEIVVHVNALPVETYFLVDSVTKAVPHIIEAGGRQETGPVDIASGLYVRPTDPWGNPIVLIDTSKGIFTTDKDKNLTLSQNTDEL